VSDLLIYGSTAPRAKTVLVYGNCQVPFLADLLGAVTERGDEYRLVCALNHPVAGKPIPEPPLGDLRDVALYLEQHDSRPAVPLREHLRAALPAGCPVVTFPTFLMGSLWPFECPEPRVRAEPGFAWGRFPIGDIVGLQVAHLGLKGDAAVDAYLELSETLMPDLAARLDWDRALIERGDSACDVTIGDYVLERFRHEHIFWTSGHLAPAPLAELAKRIDARARQTIGGTADHARRCIDAAASRLDGMGGWQLPIHPSVATALGLAFHRADARYRWYDQLWTFREYTARYIEYNTDW